MNINPDYNLWAKMIREFEGFRNKAYRDSGLVWTIGGINSFP